MGKLSLIGVVCFFFCLGTLRATHNRAGEITIRQTGDLTIEVTVTTYTKTSSTQADRDSVLVFWGDGSSEFVFRTNGDGDPLPNNRKVNYYIASHTYPGRATYTISMMDPNRNGGILNVNPPNSEGVPFYIEATYTFLNPQFQGYNNTAILLQEPIDFACVGQRFIHNPSAFDPDGDSLSFEFIVPLQDSGVNVPNYIFPNQIEPGLDNVLTLDPNKGSVVWNSPQIAGEYNIAFRINEYRNGVLISSFVRDMQILVLVCDNQPPDIAAAEELCVIAGNELRIPILVSDPDPNQLVALSAAGGPFEVVSQPAVLINGGDYKAQPINAELVWTPSCNEIRDQPYTIIIKAIDNFFDTTGLVDLHAIRIKVLGPPPLDVQVLNNSGSFDVSWESPYACEITHNNYFRGFSVWRREGSNQFQRDTCEAGLDGRGYTRIAGNLKGMVNGRYQYSDLQVVGQDGNFCYRVLAEFAYTTPSGQPYQRVESIPSEEVCLRTNADKPIITHVTIETTSSTNGEILIRWQHPKPDVLDTITFHGPYRYELMVADGIDGTNFTQVPGAVFTSPFLTGWRDTMWTQMDKNTLDQGYRYRMDFYTGNTTARYGSSEEASSIFLTAAPSDMAVDLSWAFHTPWDNYRFEIWRSEEGSPFELIHITAEESYTDRQDIENGLNYCYKIVAYGDYGIDGLLTPLVNVSQEACVIPLDNVSPCAPALQVTNICDESNPTTPGDAFSNHLSWTMPCQIDDVAKFNIYFSPAPGEELTLIGTVNFPQTTFDHKPGEQIAGCYSITAEDLDGNVSQFSTVVCVNNCPVYELPNAFTPNGDGQNDLFRPFRSRFIETVNFKVFNRWGQIVFTSNDPDLNWDGRNAAGEALSDGVYFYTCEAFESQLLNVITLNGYIELLRG